jgi:AraC-like DNA-binding protein
VTAHLYRPIPCDSEAVRLLVGYAAILRDDGMASEPLQTAAASHVYDLIALALGDARDAKHSQGSMRAARLAAIRADALANLAQVRLSPRLIARRHNVSERYVHLLFAETGETFGEFVAAARLARARELLLDPAHAASRIGDVAERVGYGDVSTFNRAFRRVYGATPSDVRVQAMIASGAIGVKRDAHRRGAPVTKKA